MIPPLDLELKYHKDQVRRRSTKYTHNGYIFGQEKEKKKMKIKCLNTYMCRGVDQDDLRTLGLAWILARTRKI